VRTVFIYVMVGIFLYCDVIREKIMEVVKGLKYV